MPVCLVKLSAVSFCSASIWGLLIISTLTDFPPPPPPPPPLAPPEPPPPPAPAHPAATTATIPAVQISGAALRPRPACEIATRSSSSHSHGRPATAVLDHAVASMCRSVRSGREVQAGVLRV